jgi:predicted dehydrogenase
MSATTEQAGAPATTGRARRRIGVGVIGFGWLGQAHSRSLLRIPTLFPEREFDAELVVCADTLSQRRDDAVRSFGFARAAADWRAVIDDPGVEVVYIAAPNMLHVELVEAAAHAGKHVFCEKPVGGTPEQTVRAEKAARGVTSGVGYNYRWAPLVRYAKQLIDGGRLGEITNYRGRFFSMYGSDPLGVLSWRFLVDQAGYGVTTDLMSHSVDLAHMLLGPITRAIGTTETFIRERPLLNQAHPATHYGRGRPEDPKGAVTNEDYAGMLCEFASGARGTFEASRSMVGPESQMAFEVYGTKGALGWNLEKLNELQVYLVEDAPHTGYRTVFGGDRFPYHGHFVPGSANGIGFEDLVVIEDYEFCRSLAEGREHEPGFAAALEWVGVQAALLRSAESGHWELVESLRED